ncbi:hypothetical protein DH2020_016330 [Rehmannia glutinosa]|uniref:Uncharacterized protein n=1 Tax=Rehmannia glutinosa TaxID=99300 RepID=A0ABR0WNP3_REHGL
MFGVLALAELQTLDQKFSFEGKPPSCPEVFEVLALTELQTLGHKIPFEGKPLLSLANVDNGGRWSGILDAMATVSSATVLPERFRNELPDPSAKVKLMRIPRDPDRYCKYQPTSLEKSWTPQLEIAPDLGIPLDLLDISVYNPPKGERIPLDPEDEELLRDDDPITPTETNGLRKKQRPRDEDISWLLKTEHICPYPMVSTKQSLREKRAKELQDSRRENLLRNLNSREKKIQDIMASFRVCEFPPVHKVNPQLKAKSVLPLFPYFDWYNDDFVVAKFDSAPTADSEICRKPNAADCLEHERRAIMITSVASSSDTEKTDKLLAYMVPSIDELGKDMNGENEDVSYSLVQEYHWDVRDDADKPRTYLVVFGESEAKYLGKSSEELEPIPVPKTVTVRRRSTVDAVELRDEKDFVASKNKYNVFKKLKWQHWPTA